MPTCPRCKKTIDDRAVSCPHCQNELKAFGHPGIPLYQSTDNSSLCDRCTYDRDDSCNFPQRPYAQSCTLFHDCSTPLVPETAYQSKTSIKSLLYQYRTAIAIALLILMSVVLALNAG